MNLSIYLLLVAVASVTASLSRFKHNQCPFSLANKVTWCHRVDDFCYEFMGKLPSANWTAAETACESIGSHLPIFKSGNEYETFSQLRKALGYKPNVVFPIGLKFDSLNFDKTKKANRNKGWKWIDGSSVDYQKWGNSDPDQHRQTVYAYDHGFWFDAKVSKKYQRSPPLCQKTCSDAPKPYTVCETPGCVRAAEALLSGMNQSVDPCYDFYEYTCGGWIQKHPMPADRSDYEQSHIVIDKVSADIKGLLQSAPDDFVNRSRPIEMTKQYYAACMDKNRKNKEKSRQVYAEFVTLGSMPILNTNWDCTKQDHFTVLLAKLHKQHWFFPFFYIYVTSDAKNVSRLLMHFDQGYTSMGPNRHNYFLDIKYNKTIRALKTLMKSTVETIASDNNLYVDRKVLQEDIDNMIRFDEEYAKIITPSSQRRNVTAKYNLRKILDLKQIMPFIQWNKYLDILLPAEVRAIVNDDSDIMFTEVKFFPKLAKLMATTDCRVKTNYIMWRLLKTYLEKPGGMMGDKFESIYHEFVKVYLGRMEKPNPIEECTLATKYALGEAVGALYVRNYFKEEARTEGLRMVEDIQNIFVNMVNGSDWMQDTTKLEAFKKVELMDVLVGYSNVSIDDNLLEEYYRTLEYDQNDSYFEMDQAKSQFLYATMLRGLLKPMDRKKWWIGGPAYINAGYWASKNHIAITAGHLQAPFFDVEYPKAVNYGAMGWIMAHELTHAFDDRGSQLDGTGNLRNWWDENTKAKFTDKLQCLIDEYSNIVVEGTNGTKIDGKRTIGENTADNVGIKGAYLSYRDYASGLQQEEARLPGLQKFTADQIFFISAGFSRCGNQRPESLISQLMTYPHSPRKYRVNTPMANLEQFSKTFNCELGTKMNPINKCSIW